MLPVPTLPVSLMALLVVFESCFTAPGFRTFCALLAGLVARTGPRTVCGMLVGAGLSRVWSHDRVHRFFSHARWSPEQVGLVLARLVVTLLVPPGAPVTVVIDDTLFFSAGVSCQRVPRPMGRRLTGQSLAITFVAMGKLSTETCDAAGRAHGGGLP